jgi:hypothetical protein
MYSTQIGYYIQYPLYLSSIKRKKNGQNNCHKENILNDYVQNLI